MKHQGVSVLSLGVFVVHGNTATVISMNSYYFLYTTMGMEDVLYRIKNKFMTYPDHEGQLPELLRGTLNVTR